MSKILDLRKYDLVFTTSFEVNHGITGHIFEMIEYYLICKLSNINVGIALLDGFDKETFTNILHEKYDFTEHEIKDITDNTLVSFQPYIILANSLCIVDGDARLKGCTIYADHVFLFRCWEGPLDYYSNSKSIKQTHLLQDFSMYQERYENLNIKVVDYTKKLLWDRYKKPAEVKTNTAMFYLTSGFKARPADEIQGYIEKYKFEKYLIITDIIDRYKHLVNNSVSVELIPVANLFEKFDTYIYTPVPALDCSPRFIVECAVFGKNVISECTNSGVDARIRSISSGIESLLLNHDDFFVHYAKQHIFGN